MRFEPAHAAQPAGDEVTSGGLLGSAVHAGERRRRHVVVYAPAPQLDGEASSSEPTVLVGRGHHRRGEGVVVDQSDRGQPIQHSLRDVVGHPAPP
jgi:hypothetical protein